MQNLNKILNNMALATTQPPNPCSRVCSNRPGQPPYTTYSASTNLVAAKTGMMAPMLESPYVAAGPSFEPTTWSARWGPYVYAVPIFNLDGFGAMKVRPVSTSNELGCCCVQGNPSDPMNCLAQRKTLQQCNAVNGLFIQGSTCDEFGGEGGLCCKQKPVVDMSPIARPRTTRETASMQEHVPNLYAGNAIAEFPYDNCWIAVDQPIPCDGEYYQNEPDALKMLLFIMEPTVFYHGWASGGDGPTAAELVALFEGISISERFGDGSCYECTPQWGQTGWGKFQCYVKNKYNVPLMVPDYTTC